MVLPQGVEGHRHPKSLSVETVAVIGVSHTSLYSSVSLYRAHSLNEP